MLLRSASTPILKSLIHAATAAKDSRNELLITTEASTTKIPRVPSLKSSSSSSSPSPSTTNNRKSLRRAMSDTNISELLTPPPLPKPRQKPWQMIPPSISIPSGEESLVATSSSRASTPVVDDEGRTGDGNCNSRGSDGGHGKFSSGSNDDDGDADAYYRGAIRANPENSLVLSNYAKFLKEVRGDVARAEEYCGRAIVADQRDGSALSMYAEILWERSRDAERAGTYFDRAVQAAPDDCYVMASYARFLWEVEEEEEDDDDDDDEEKENQSKNEMMKSMNHTPPFLSPLAAPPSVAAVS